MLPRTILKEDVVAATYVQPRGGLFYGELFRVQEDWYAGFCYHSWCWTCRWWFTPVGDQAQRGDRDEVALAFSRFATHPSSQLAWHAMSEPEVAPGTILVFASCDESVQGRCMTAQLCVDRATVRVTLIDARLTPARLGDIVTTLADCRRPIQFKGKCEVAKHVNDALCCEDAHNVFRAIAALAGGWSVPRTDSSSTGLDWETMAEAAGAPGPRRTLGNGRGISLAGGGMVIATVSTDTAQRIRADYRIRLRSVDHRVDHRDATPLILRVTNTVWTELGLPPRPDANALKTPPLLILCAHTGPIGYADHRQEDPDAEDYAKVLTESVLIAGVPLAQIFAQARRLHARLRDRDWDLFCYFDALTPAALAYEDALHAKEKTAMATIRRIASSDVCVRAIKERVWRPHGRLTERMVHGVDACPP